MGLDAVSRLVSNACAYQNSLPIGFATASLTCCARVGFLDVAGPLSETLTVVGIDVAVRYAHFNWSCLLAKRMSFLEALYRGCANTAPEVRLSA